MKNIHTWLAEYGESHQHATNKLIHWVCVPSIFFSIVALLYSVKLPFYFGKIQGNVAFVVTGIVWIYYLLLSPSIAMGMLFFCAICLGLSHFLETSLSFPLWAIALLIFVVAWIGQFYGHKLEGKKPSFLKDVQFLMIGPAWLMSFIYKKLGIRF